MKQIYQNIYSQDIKNPMFFIIHVRVALTENYTNCHKVEATNSKANVPVCSTISKTETN